ncbi:CBS-domain-containing membrane protein [Desulfocapsa sulfexigens DSM 10523]|uniref:CBS-domain-containing membrane protein n=1 Tax=Desulfocapsa sulfexigens (strain DSM 10523 / SB164P1) TaxID=1167006 RepID=M1PC80_DESSD|nr:CBS domain-containing protein [Desulfocapsa sulfexigens]AGF77355.1 CBS-domain-containing membrane protein [Desulfocapsa sulfexigens DSM 10523]
METAKSSTQPCLPERLAISDEDIYEAMKEISGYLDITASDFKELYKLSYQHAMERLTNSILARDIMSREVVSVAANTPLLEAAKRMAAASISGVPVLDNEERVVGVLSEQDFLKDLGTNNRSFMSIITNSLQGKGCVAVSSPERVAADIMSHPPFTIRENTPLGEITVIMSKNNINRLPVLDQQGEKIVGILSRGDIVRSQLL